MVLITSNYTGDKGLARSEGVNKKMNTLPFFIACTNRSGSHFLTSLINSTEVIPPIVNYLNRLGPDIIKADILSAMDELYENISRDWTSPVTHWGIKLHMDRFAVARNWLELIEQPTQWIWLRRGNKIRQAISDLKVGETQIEGIHIDDPPETQELGSAEIEVDFDKLCNRSVHFFIEDNAWEFFFRHHSIEPHTLYYEDFIEESTWDAMVRGVFDFLGVPYERPLRISTDWIRQSTEKVPSSYERLIRRLLLAGIPLEYTYFHEPNLETFRS